MAAALNKDIREKSPVYRRTFVPTDQNFIAATPAVTDSLQGLKMLRIENASLWDLFNYFRDSDLVLPVGSAVLLESASHLANVGTAVYAEEQVQVKMQLRQMFEGTIYVIPCPPMRMEGSSSSVLVRLMVELSAWLKHVTLGDNGHLAETTNLVRLAS